MFDSLSDKLQRVFKNLRGEGKLTAENMEAALKEIRVALLEADVHFKVVKTFMAAVREKAMGQDVLNSFTPAQQVTKIVKDELIAVLGTHASRLRTASQPPTVIMIVGLQGSGKTTSTGKLAKHLAKNGHRPLVVSVDVYRPAARSSCRWWPGRSTFRFTKARRRRRSRCSWRSRQSARRKSRADLILVDTAGRCTSTTS